jgi:hypothetical protein
MVVEIIVFTWCGSIILRHSKMPLLIARQLGWV